MESNPRVEYDTELAEDTSVRGSAAGNNTAANDASQEQNGVDSNPLSEQPKQSRSSAAAHPPDASPTSCSEGSPMSVDSRMGILMFEGQGTHRHHHPEEEAEETAAPAPRKIGVLQLAFICYSYVAAGPFGLEATVRSAGPLAAILGLLILPPLYIVPQMIIVTEMGGMMPSAHGNVIWIQRAFGDSFAFFGSINNIISNLIDGAVYPTLSVDYLAQAFFPMATKWQRYGLGLSFIIVGLSLDMLSARHVGYVATFLSVVIVTPFFVGFCAGAKYLNWDDLTRTESYLPEGGHDWGTFVSTELWLMVGWNSLGNLAEEVESPLVFLKGMSLALVMCLLTYLLPLTVAVCVPIPSSVTDPWAEGYLATAFGQVLPGLKDAIAIAGATGSLAVFASAMLMYSRMTWGASERGWLPRILSRRSRNKAPYIAMAVHGIVAMFLTMFDFTFLVNTELVVAAANYTLAVACLARLRFTEPHAKRPFKFPPSNIAACIIVFFPILVFGTVLLTSLIDNYVNFLVGMSVNAIVLSAWFIRKAILKRRGKWDRAHREGVHGMSDDDLAMLEQPLSEEGDKEE